MRLVLFPSYNAISVFALLTVQLVRGLYSGFRAWYLFWENLHCRVMDRVVVSLNCILLTDPCVSVTGSWLC